MSARNFLEPSDLVASLATCLESWAGPLKGKVQVSRDGFDLLQLLILSPVGFLVLVQWVGDEDQTGEDHAGIVTNHFKVVLSQGRGLNVKPGNNLIAERSKMPPLYALVSSCRAHVCRFAFSDPVDEVSSVWPAYKGSSPFVAPDGAALDAQELRFTLETAIDLGTELPEASSSVSSSSGEPTSESSGEVS
ncbi:MAG: hypothetical protein PHI35_00650 [Victivallaceae bacterium]|nr:hypothetical protein [Victivallaceae bacterium]